MDAPTDGHAAGTGGSVTYLRERFPMASSTATTERQHDTTNDDDNKDKSAHDERREARQEMDRWQDDADRRRVEVRDRARAEARHGQVASRDAVRSYVRANNRLVNLFTPPGFLRPGEVLRSTFDMWGQMFETQRAIVDEMVQSYRDNIRFLDREAERDERVDRRDEYGYYAEDDEYQQDLREDRDEDRQDRDERNRSRQERRRQRLAS